MGVLEQAFKRREEAVRVEGLSCPGPPDEALASFRQHNGGRRHCGWRASTALGLLSGGVYIQNVYIHMNSTNEALQAS